MSKTLTVELPDEVYNELEQRGIPTAQLIETTLRRNGVTPKRALSEAERSAARERFRQHIGSALPAAANKERSLSIEAARQAELVRLTQYARLKGVDLATAHNQLIEDELAYEYGNDHTGER